MESRLCVRSFMTLAVHVTLAFNCVALPFAVAWRSHGEDEHLATYSEHQFAVDCGLCPSQVFWGTLKQSMILDNADSFSGSDKHVSLLVPDSCRPAVAICFLDCISLLEPAAGNTIRASVLFDFVLLFFLLVPAEQAGNCSASSSARKLSSVVARWCR